MPGHPIEGEVYTTEALKAYQQLEELIEVHDAVFLLMDTREQVAADCDGSGKNKVRFFCVDSVCLIGEDNFGYSDFRTFLIDLPYGSPWI